MEISNRFGEDASEEVVVDKVPVPDLGDILTLGRQENFSLFIPKHRNLSAKLINIFLRKLTLFLFSNKFEIIFSSPQRLKIRSNCSL